MEAEAICANTPEDRRYRRSMIVAGLVYAATVVGASALLIRVELPTPLRILVAVVPMIPVLLMLGVYIRYFRAMDEFRRRVQSEAILIAAALVGFAALGYGFLEAFVQFPRLSMIWVLPAMIVILGARPAVRRPALPVRG